MTKFLQVRVSSHDEVPDHYVPLAEVAPMRAMEGVRLFIDGMIHGNRISSIKVTKQAGFVRAGRVYVDFRDFDWEANDRTLREMRLFHVKSNAMRPYRLLAAHITGDKRWAARAEQPDVEIDELIAREAAAQIASTHPALALPAPEQVNEESSEQKVPPEADEPSEILPLNRKQFMALMQGFSHSHSTIVKELQQQREQDRRETEIRRREHAELRRDVADAMTSVINCVQACVDEVNSLRDGQGGIQAQLRGQQTEVMGALNRLNDRLFTGVFASGVQR
jgi:hypothetical protein